MLQEGGDQFARHVPTCSSDGVFSHGGSMSIPGWPQNPRVGAWKVPAWEGRFSLCAGINRHVVGNARVLQERRKRLHLGPESYGRRREASVEA
jgi:hypothetical protein